MGAENLLIEEGWKAPMRLITASHSTAFQHIGKPRSSGYLSHAACSVTPFGGRSEQYTQRISGRGCKQRDSVGQGLRCHTFRAGHGSKIASQYRVLAVMHAIIHVSRKDKQHMHACEQACQCSGSLRALAHLENRWPHQQYRKQTPVTSMLRVLRLGVTRGGFT